MTISPEALRTLKGLEWLGTEQHVSEAKSTWQTIVPIGARSFERVAATDDPTEMHRIAVAAWLKALDESGLRANSFEVLLSLGGYATGGLWQRVLVSDPQALLNVAFPEPEFVVMNIERTRFVAITTEEHELLVFCGIRDGDHWTLCSS